jgi:hypothetical protein
MEAMDSDDKMMFAAFMEEAPIAAIANEHLMMLACLLALYARDS